MNHRKTRAIGMALMMAASALALVAAAPTATATGECEANIDIACYYEVNGRWKLCLKYNGVTGECEIAG